MSLGHGLRCEELVLDVDGHEAVEVVAGHVGHLVAPVVGRVVQQHADGPETGAHTGDGRGEGGRVGHVADAEEGGRLALQFGGERRAGGGVEVAEADFGALRMEGPHQRFTDAAGAARDEDGAPGERRIAGGVGGG
jgi:hypothetical protein